MDVKGQDQTEAADRNKESRLPLAAGRDQTFEAKITLISPKDERPSSETRVLKYINTFTPLIKAFAWPLIALIIFLLLRGQVNNFFEQLPYSQSAKVGVGSFFFEIKQAAREVGDPRLAKLLEGLSADALEALMKMRGGYQALVSYRPDYSQYTVESEKTIKVYQELERSGLAKFRIDPQKYYQSLQELGLKRVEDANEAGQVFQPARPLNESERDRAASLGVNLTPTGEKALDLITTVVVQQLQHPKRESKETDEQSKE